MPTPPTTDVPLAEKLFCPTCKGKGEIAPAKIIKDKITSVICPTCKGYGAPKPPAKGSSVLL